MSLKREILEELDSSKYLGQIVRKNGDDVEDVMNRVSEGEKVSDAMSWIWILGVN